LYSLCSVIWYSLCNEAGCGNGTLLEGDLVERAKTASYDNDGSRAVGANMGWIAPVTPRTPMSDALDVMGMSHANLAKGKRETNDILGSHALPLLLPLPSLSEPTPVMKFHQQEPTKPLVMTECCSCQNQRGEDGDMPHNTTLVHYTNEVSGCLAEQTQVSDGNEFVGGTFVWTLHDYMVRLAYTITLTLTHSLPPSLAPSLTRSLSHSLPPSLPTQGEPGKWPHVSSSFGALDLAGFPKPPAWFYRSMWLSNISTSDPGRPPLPPSTTVRIVESWATPTSGSTRDIHVYSNAPLVGLFVNNVAVSAAPAPVAVISGVNTAATFKSVSYAPGTLTAKAYAADGTTALATHTIHSWGSAASLALTMDVPSAASGTGSKVFVDGMDVALVRASVLDAAGNVVGDSNLNITFAVTAGPGYVAGVGNGDPACQEPSQVSWRSAYHGLARAIIRVTLDAEGTEADRALRAAVNIESGKSPRSSTILQGAAMGAPTSITITAKSAVGVHTLVVPLSVDPADSVLAVASASVGIADVGAADE
jgi:hypothetical protein